MSRYVDNPEATAQALRGGWLHTGDSATIDEDGFLFFVDRNKQMIRRGGLNISSAEVEGACSSIPALSRPPSSRFPTRCWAPTAGVVVAGDPPPSAEELIEFCAARLADYKVPIQVDFVDALPRNAMNRVMKGVLIGESEALGS